MPVLAQQAGMPAFAAGKIEDATAGRQQLPMLKYPG
jgi:hypothetical protein